MASVGQVVYNLEDFHSTRGLVSTRKRPYLDDTVSWNGDPATKQAYISDQVKIFEKDENGNPVLNLVAQFNANYFTKLGIQAPPGTKIKLNSNKIIMIGRTGVYELDDDIRVTSLYFERPERYVLDVPATEESLENGKAGFSKAEKDRSFAIKKLNGQYMRELNAYMIEYKKIKNTSYGNAAIANAITSLIQLDNDTSLTLEDDSYWIKYFEYQAQIPDLLALDNKYKDETNKDTEYWTRYKVIQNNYNNVYNIAQSQYIAGINGIYKQDPDQPYEELRNIIIDFLY